jgi:hypothetical protein
MNTEWKYNYELISGLTLWSSLWILAGGMIMLLIQQ